MRFPLTFLLTFVVPVSTTGSVMLHISLQIVVVVVEAAKTSQPIVSGSFSGSLTTIVRQRLDSEDGKHIVDSLNHWDVPRIINPTQSAPAFILYFNPEQGRNALVLTGMR